MAITRARCTFAAGRSAALAETAARFVDKPGDDPDFRKLLAAVNRSGAQLPTLGAGPSLSSPR